MRRVLVPQTRMHVCAEPCPVMNWWYGGAWEFGSIEEFGTAHSNE